MQYFGNVLSNGCSSYYLRPGKSARPAPAELPQDRKVARVGGCSGAMFGLPFFLALKAYCQKDFKFLRKALQTHYLCLDSTPEVVS
jgi:hypothetical protein